jgi:hypothetical protein
VGVVVVVGVVVGVVEGVRGLTSSFWLVMM